jgi:precorrin-2/cobalt-factor-2 C20-methyltransferase
VGCLRQADVVFLPGGTVRSRAAEIVSTWCQEEQLKTYVLPMQKDRRQVQEVYDHLSSDIAEAYHAGRRVVVAVEGDVSIYASIHYVLERLLADGIAVEQEAGIPSFIAAASVVGLSLVSQRQRLVVIPGNAQTDELYQLLQCGHTVVLMKLSQCEDELKTLLRLHPSIECHYFENVGTAQQLYLTSHADILARPVPYFSLAVLRSN